ncbi:uncharacterized protein LOC141683858 isoform X1 [Apium graveolens]|uniref:uncharacterized protein LOC141683858 isoform X1 n=2 Tax=Apium graveolens TaxID=4045 RepID=UPI003D7B27A6
MHTHNQLIMTTRVHANIILIGHGNSGKSTTINNLIEKLKEAAKVNQKTFKYAWVLNKLNSEYERGFTLYLDFFKFETSKYRCSVIDAPGHIKNMIIGMSQADFALLIVDSTIDGFEAGIFERDQIRLHALLALTFGVKQMICCCNKMDATTPRYSEARYNKIKNEVSSELKNVGYNPTVINFVPISALEGDNIMERSTRLSWYTGPTLYEAFDMLTKCKIPSCNFPHPLQDVQYIRGLGTVFAGRVRTRSRKRGNVVTFGSNLESFVQSDNALSDMGGKVHINIIVIGHLKSGKSTTTGHLFHSLGGISDRHLQRLENEVTEGNKKSFKYAWVLDKIKAAFGRGFTIDISLWKFETSKYHCTVFDAPGHRHLIKNMVIGSGTGTSQPDCAVLVIDSTRGAFEIGISDIGQARGYILLAHTLGVKEMICCCNKMDATSPKYSEERYNKIKKVVCSYLTKFGYIADSIPFIPISALEGDNMIQYSERLPWYKGLTLYDALDSINEPKRPKPAGGQVENSSLNSVRIGSHGPYGLTVKIERHHESPLEAFRGDDDAFNVKNVAVKDLGIVASKTEDDTVKRVNVKAVDEMDRVVTCAAAKTGA